MKPYNIRALPWPIQCTRFKRGLAENQALRGIASQSSNINRGEISKVGAAVFRKVLNILDTRALQTKTTGFRTCPGR
jgi:hypothetical protein